MRRVIFVLSLILAFWTTLLLWPQENTLTLAAAGKIPFNAAWGYRFRLAELLNTANDVPALLQLFRPVGARALCVVLVLLHLPALVRKPPRILLALAGIAAGLSILLFFTLANPALVIARQRVMGGAGLSDGLGLGSGGEKIGITENCLAAINPSDLRAISSLELLEKKSAGALPQIRLIDLKVVEKNYRLLTLKDEKGAPLFSDAARAFARAEILYAQKIQPELLSATRLCLIANFDTAPENETAPFSRAREILEARKKARLDTRVIQLPAGFTNR